MLSSLQSIRYYETLRLFVFVSPLVCHNVRHSVSFLLGSVMNTFYLLFLCWCVYYFIVCSDISLLLLGWVCQLLILLLINWLVHELICLMCCHCLILQFINWLKCLYWCISPLISVSWWLLEWQWWVMYVDIFTTILRSTGHLHSHNRNSLQ